MAGMEYKMVGGDPSIKEKGYDMNGKDSGCGKGMGYEMIGSDPKVETKESKEKKD